MCESNTAFVALTHPDPPDPSSHGAGRVQVPGREVELSTVGRDATCDCSTCEHAVRRHLRRRKSRAFKMQTAVQSASAENTAFHRSLHKRAVPLRDVSGCVTAKWEEYRAPLLLIGLLKCLLAESRLQCLRPDRLRRAGLGCFETQLGTRYSVLGTSVNHYQSECVEGGFLRLFTYSYIKFAMVLCVQTPN